MSAHLAAFVICAAGTRAPWLSLVDTEHGPNAMESRLSMSAHLAASMMCAAGSHAPWLSLVDTEQAPNAMESRLQAAWRGRGTITSAPTTCA